MGSSGILAIPNKFFNKFIYFFKNPWWDFFIRIILSLYINMEWIHIVTILSLLIHGHCIYLHLFRSSLSSHSNVIFHFLNFRSYMYFAKFITKYFIFHIVLFFISTSNFALLVYGNTIDICLLTCVLNFVYSSLLSHFFFKSLVFFT